MVSKLSMLCILNEWPQPLIKGISPSEFPFHLNNSAKSFYSVKTFFFIIWILRHNSLFLINLFSPCIPQKSHFFQWRIKNEITLSVWILCVCVLFMYIGTCGGLLICLCACTFRGQRSTSDVIPQMTGCTHFSLSLSFVFFISWKWVSHCPGAHM